MSKRIAIFDSTLRDGAQAEGISFSVKDKLKIVKLLDNLGLAYIEAGNPGSNPKDLEFFAEVKDLKLQNAKLTAFGSTRRKGVSVAEDANILSLAAAGTDVVTIFGKSWDFHVTDIIQTTLAENLDMIRESIAYFKELGKEVIYDAEHLYDGYKHNPEYAMLTLEAAYEGGADALILCDTNGGTFPSEIYDITKLVCDKYNVSIGVHAHNDAGLAVANSIMAVEAGADHVQGTFIGFGERCGNTNLSSIIPSLQLKKGLSCIPEEQMRRLTRTAIKLAEIANVNIKDDMPYIGRSAFAHKGGMHIDGVNKAAHSFEHVDPELVGNERRILMSEVAGRSTILAKIREFDSSLTKDSLETQEIIDKLKELEHIGYQFEGAESTFELVIRKQLGKYTPFFVLENFTTMGRQPVKDSATNSAAIIKIKVDGKTEMTAAEGNGPVNALDKALRKALEVFYPNLKSVSLIDFKVRVVDTKDATGAKVRVLIESTDGEEYWSTVGVSTDIIEASWLALVDSLEYKLLRDIEKQKLGVGQWE